MKLIRRFSLVALAALALTMLGGAAAASASPSGFVAGAYPATLKGASTGGSLEIGGFKFSCTSTPFSAEHKGPSSTLAWYTGGGSCNGWVGSAPVSWKGCGLSFDPGPTAPSFAGTATTYGAEGCGLVEIYNLFGDKCTLLLDLEAPYTGTATFENAKESVNVFANLEDVSRTVSGTGCWPVSGSGTADFNLQWNVTATSGGKATSLKVVSELPFGFFLEGKASEKESEQPRFAAETYPRAISGGGLTFSAFGVTINCSESSLKDSISAATKQLTLDATYGGCKTVGLKTTVEMKSCYYTLNAQNAGPPYTGSFGVACTKEGDKIEYKAFNAEGGLYCTIKVGPQSGLGGVSMSNVGAGASRGVSLNAAIETVQWERSGTCGTASGSTGKLTGTPTLNGVE